MGPFFGGRFFGGGYYGSASVGVRKNYDDYLSLDEYLRKLTARVEEHTPKKQRKKLKLKPLVVEDRIEQLPEVQFLKQELDEMYAKGAPLMPMEINTLKSIMDRLEVLQRQIDDEDVLLLL